MSYNWVIPLVAVAAQLFLIAGLARKAVAEANTRLVAALLLVVAGWNAGLFGLFFFADPATAELWVRVFRTGVCFGPPIILHFTLSVMRYRSRVWSIVLSVGYGAAALVAVANAAGWLVTGVSRHEYGWLPNPSPLYDSFTALVIVYLVLAGVLTGYRYIFPLTSHQRVQIKFNLFAYAVLIPFIITNILAIHGFHIFPLGSLGAVLWGWIVAYAITRHRIVDIDYVVRKALSFALASLPALVPGALGMAFIGTTSAAKDPFLLGFGAVVVAVGAGLVIPTLQQRLETRVQRALFRDRWDSRRRLQDLTAKLVHILDRGELVKYLGDALVEILEPKVCEILLVDDRSRRVGVAYPAVGAPPTPDGAADALHAVTEPVLSAELEPSGALARLFACRGWELGVPLRVRNDAIGLVGLGANRDLRIYSAEDIELLARVAAAASVALENAKLSRLLRQSEAGLERANKLSSVGQLAAGIAHEIRNPLVAVKTFLDLLPEHIEDRAFVDHFRELSLSELKRVTTLISDLLTLGKSTQIKRCQVALLPTLQPVVRLMESNAQKRDVRLTYAADPQLPELWGDPDELKQIVLNLLLNAIEASPPDAEVRLSVEVGDDAGETVVIEVQDEGPGIPKESFEDIFHPFFTTKETGTGLGLALVHQMVIEHAGTIEVESAPGRGAVFRVTLPAMAVEPNAVDRRVARTGT